MLTIAVTHLIRSRIIHYEITRHCASGLLLVIARDNNNISHLDLAYLQLYAFAPNIRRVYTILFTIIAYIERSESGNYRA